MSFSPIFESNNQNTLPKKSSVTALSKKNTEKKTRVDIPQRIKNQKKIPIPLK
jgi:hypothetical protein